MRQAGEPSVEEILDSIKKVIARDNRDGAAEQRRARELPVSADSRSAAADEVLDLGTVGEYIDDDEPDQVEAGDVAETPLVARQTVNSISDSLAALAMLAQPPAPPQIVRSGETSLEGMARSAAPGAGRMARQEPAGLGGKAGRHRNRTDRRQEGLDPPGKYR